MTNGRLRLALAGISVPAGGTSWFPQTPSAGPLRGQAALRPPTRAPLLRAWGTSRFPTPLHAHGPEAGP